MTKSSPSLHKWGILTEIFYGAIIISIYKKETRATLVICADMRLLAPYFFLGEKLKTWYVLQRNYLVVPFFEGGFLCFRKNT